MEPDWSDHRYANLSRMELMNSTQSLPKANYVRLDVKETGETPGRTLRKSNFLRSLALQDGEVESALEVEAKQVLEGESCQPRRVHHSPTTC